MDDVTIEGNIRSISVKVAKAGEARQLTNKLIMTDPRPALLSELSDLQPEALKAMLAAQEAGAKIEIPLMSEEMSLVIRPVTGEKEVASSHTILKKLVYNASGVDPVAELTYVEPALKAIMHFLYDHLNYNIEVTISQSQPDLEL